MKKIVAFLLFSTLMLACKKDKSSDGPGPGPDAQFYFAGNLNGQNISYEIDGSGDFEMITANDAGIDAPQCTFDYGCGLSPAGEEGPYIEVSFPGLFSGDCGDEGALFSGLFKKGPYNLNGAALNAQVDYFDENEVHWSSANGPQDGSTFEVTRSERLESAFGVSQNVDGKISCKLYTETGAVIELENASFALNYWPWF